MTATAATSSTKGKMAEWKQFFVNECRLGEELSTNYAIIFTKHRIQMSMLKDLDRTVLKDIGVTAVGDAIAILNACKRVKDNEEDTIEILPTREDTGNESVAVSSPKVQPAARLTSKLGRKRPLSPQQNDSVASPTVPSKKRIIGPTEATAVSASSEPLVGVLDRAKKPAPDRHDRYIVKLPQGTTAKSRELLKLAHQLDMKAAGAGAERLKKRLADDGKGLATGKGSSILSRLGMSPSRAKIATTKPTNTTKSLDRTKITWKQPEASSEVSSTTTEEDAYPITYGTLQSDRIGLEQKSALSRLKTNAAAELATSPGIRLLSLTERDLSSIKKTVIVSPSVASASPGTASPSVKRRLGAFTANGSPSVHSAKALGVFARLG